MTNPLATEEQRVLDRRVAQIAASRDFEPARQVARTAYLAAYLGVPTSEALSRLDAAIDELTIGMLKTAVNNDAARPAVYWVGSEGRTWLGNRVPGSRWAFDNPDTIYRTVPIDPDGRYVVHGRLRGAGTADAAFSLVNDLITQTTVDYVDGHRLRTRRVPEYTVTIGPEPARGRMNHLQSTADTVQLFIRSTISDWAQHRPDSLRVSRVDRHRAPPRRTDAQIALEAQQLLLRGAPVFGPALLGAKTRVNPVNTIAAPGSTPGALVTQANAFGHFRLTDDEALVVRLDPSGADYVTLPITDPWMVGVAPGRYQSSLNHSQADRDRDGRFTYVVSRRDPGVANWISTAGRTEGTIMARWQRLQRGSRPEITSHVVALDDLPDVLPRETRAVERQQRIADVRARHRAYLTRFADT